MSKLDRGLQLEVLEALEAAHPRYLDAAVVEEWDERFGEDAFASNLLYLEEHGLLTSGIIQSLDGSIHYNVAGMRITAAGRDFIADDGGLSAVLSVVTVKLHEDSIRALLVKRIESDVADPTVKSELIKQVKSLPAEGLKTLTTKALEAGWAALPDAIPLLQKWLGHLMQ